MDYFVNMDGNLHSSIKQLTFNLYHFISRVILPFLVFKRSGTVVASKTSNASGKRSGAAASATFSQK